MALNNGYATGGSMATGTSNAPADSGKDKTKYWSLAKLKRAYLDYLGTKREEIDEQQDSRRFVHGSQWTAAQIDELNRRKQPVVWNNRTKRKINGIVGTLQKLKQDPKAFPRTPKHEQGADLATAALRYALERCEWEHKDPLCAEMCAIDGIGGLEFNLRPGKDGVTEVDIDPVYVDSFFYDPRSVAYDFSDARYMGVGKWLDLEAAIALFPDKKEELEADSGVGDELSSNSDRDNREYSQWYQTDDEECWRIRLVECWYKHEEKWCWAVFTGSQVIKEGASPFVDEDGNAENKYEMFSAYIDQDTDRYGFVRDLKPLNQEINMRRSKALYTMLSRRIIAPQGAFDDVEVARREAARSDGMVIFNETGGTPPQFDDVARLAETKAQLEFLQDVKTDLESFGPNVAVTGEGLENSSGRAIHLLQQAGLADLGPFIQSYRGWKIRIYRKMWNAIQRFWEGERWIRITDDDDLTQFVQINGVQMDPLTGQSTLVNAIGELDVDIILDEGPDTVNQMADAYDTLTVLAGKGGEVPSQILIELAPLPVAVKKKLLAMLNPQGPEQDLKMRAAMAEIAAKEAEAKLKDAQAVKALADAQVAMAGDNIDDEMQLKQMEAEMNVHMADQEHQQAMQHAEQEHRFKMQSKQQEMGLKAQENAQNLQFKQQELAVKQQGAVVDQRIKQQGAMQEQRIKARGAAQDQEYARRGKEQDLKFRAKEAKAKAVAQPKKASK